MQIPRTQFLSRGNSNRTNLQAGQFLKSAQSQGDWNKEKILIEDETRVKVLPDCVLSGYFEFRSAFITIIMGVRYKATGKV